MYKGIERRGQYEANFTASSSRSLSPVQADSDPSLTTERKLVRNRTISSRGSSNGHITEEISTLLEGHHESLKEEFKFWSNRQEDLFARLCRQLDSNNHVMGISRESATNGGLSTQLVDFSSSRPCVLRPSGSGSSKISSTVSSSATPNADQKNALQDCDHGEAPLGSTVQSVWSDTGRVQEGVNSEKPLSEFLTQRDSVQGRIAMVKQIGGDGLFDSAFKIKFSTEKFRRRKGTALTFWFETMCAITIMANSIIIAADTEMKARGIATWDSLDIAGHIVNGWFVAEVLIRMRLNGLVEYFTSKDEAGWNIFDMMLVIIWLVDILLGEIPNEGVRVILRIIRLLRVLRTLRIFRFIREVREFRKMIYAISNTLNTLLWSMLLLVFEIFFFSIAFMQAVNDLKETDKYTDFSALDDKFGRMSRAFYSLFRSICNGISWGEVMNPLLQLSPDWLYAGMFIFFISMTLFGIMNVLTAVFVESAMSCTQHNRDLLVDEKESAKKMYNSHIREIFKQIDTDKSGSISTQEIERIFLDPGMSRLLEALEIDAYDAHSMFKLLDLDDSGTIDIDEFCEGCLRLKGEAKSFDVHCLMYESQRLATKTRALLVCHEEAYGEIRRLVRTTEMQGSDVYDLRSDVAFLKKEFVSLNSSLSDLRDVSVKQLKSLKRSMISTASRESNTSPISIGQATVASHSDLATLDTGYVGRRSANADTEQESDSSRTAFNHPAHELGVPLDALCQGVPLDALCQGVPLDALCQGEPLDAMCQGEPLDAMYQDLRSCIDESIRVHSSSNVFEPDVDPDPDPAPRSGGYGMLRM